MQVQICWWTFAYAWNCSNFIFDTCEICSEKVLPCYLNTTVEFCYHSNEQNIILTFCGALESQNYKKLEALYIDEEISQWLKDNSTRMKDLDVSSLRLLICKGLMTLPEGLGNLTSLTSLNLFGSESLTTLPEGLGTCLLWHHWICLGVRAWRHYWSDWGTWLVWHHWICLDVGTWRHYRSDWGTWLLWHHKKKKKKKKLYLYCCSSLTTLPEGLENLTFLTNLICLGVRSCNITGRDCGTWFHLSILNSSLMFEFHDITLRDWGTWFFWQ